MSIATPSIAPTTLKADPRVLLSTSPMSAFQWVAVLTTFAMSALDGFDVLAVTLVAPSLVHQWHVTPAALGLVFSVGLVGMAFGSFIVAPLGDVAGRRTLARIALAIMTAGMFLSARANGVGLLALYRLITGVGIGAVVAIINPLAAEYANIRRRELAIGLMAIGFPLGGVVGGLSAAYLLTHGGWRAVFVVGGVFGLVLAAASLFLLPEPIAFLVERQGPKALAQVNRFLRRCGHPRWRACRRGRRPRRRCGRSRSSMPANCAAPPTCRRSSSCSSSPCISS